MSYHVAPHIFFLVEGDQLLVWNCKSHQQFLLTPEFTQTLFSLSSPTPEQQTILSQLQQAGIVIHTNEPSTWGWDQLSQLFHIGTQDVPYDDNITSAEHFNQQYVDQCQPLAHNMPQWFQHKTGPCIELPSPQWQNYQAPYADVLQQRLTSRQFHGNPITQQQLSDLLYASFGLIHGDWQTQQQGAIKIAGVRKASPSSGGLHAEEAYVLIYHVEGMAPGLYYYRPQDHQLTELQLGNFEDQVIQWNRQQYYSKGLAVGVYLTARLDKYWWKYQHSRSYRIMLMDMGHISQTFLLNATALGLNTWLTGAFADSDIEQFLNINREKESVMLFVGAGHGANNPLPKGLHPKST